MARKQKLTAKQEAFVREYLIDMNATQAAIRAGYSERTAYRIGADLLQKTSARTAIEAALKERERRVEVTQDQVLRDLLEVKERCLQRAPVTDMRGRQIQDEAGRDVWAFDVTAAKNTLEEIKRDRAAMTEKMKGEQLADFIFTVVCESQEDKDTMLRKMGVPITEVFVSSTALRRLGNAPGLLLQAAPDRKPHTTAT